MDEKSVLHEITVFLSKAGASILAIIVGVMARLSHDILMKKKYSFLEILAIMGISIAGGILAGFLCSALSITGPTAYSIIVLCSKCAELIFKYLHENFDRLFSPVIDFLLNRKK
jgi:hypothetical protein